MYNLDELRTEGPFGDHTGFYSLEDLYPVLHVTCITHRKDPIYATTIVGKPPQEDAYMGKAVERIFLPLMKLTIPELVDINLPIEGVFHNSDDRFDQEVVSGTGAQSDERDLVARARRCSPSAWSSWMKTSTCRISGCDAEGLQPHRPGARHSVHAGSGGFTRPRRRDCQITDRRWASTLRASGQAKDLLVPGPMKLLWMQDQGARRWQMEGAGKESGW